MVEEGEEGADGGEEGGGETRRCLESRNFCDKASRPSSRALGGTFPRRRQGGGLLDRRDERAVLLRAPLATRRSNDVANIYEAVLCVLYTPVCMYQPYRVVLPRLARQLASAAAILISSV